MVQEHKQKLIFLSGHTTTKFEAIQHCIVPLSKQLNAQQQQTSKDLVNHFLASKPKSIHSKLKVFLTLIDVISIFRRGKSFKKSSPSNQHAVLSSLFNSKISLFRKGFWGLNALAKLGVYAQTSIHPTINYTMKPYPSKEHSHVTQSPRV